MNIPQALGLFAWATTGLILIWQAQQRKKFEPAYDRTGLFIGGSLLVLMGLAGAYLSL